MLRCEQISKKFGSVHALNEVSVSFRRGKITGVLGENGAGKTTLMNILYGLTIPDSGKLHLDDISYSPDSPRDAMRNGISMVHQTQALVEDFTVLENIILGKEPVTIPGVIDFNLARKKIRSIFISLGFDLSLDSKIDDLDPFSKQIVEIAKSLMLDGDFLILDEPTSLLAPLQIERLFEVLEKIKKQNKGVIIVTHRLAEVERHVDRVVVLRNGKLELDAEKSTLRRDRLLKAIGGEKNLAILKRRARIEKSELNIDQRDYIKIEIKEMKPVVAGSGLNDFNLDLNKNEIFGLLGLPGNGQEELTRCLAGLEISRLAKIVIGDREFSGKQIKKIRNEKVGFIFPDKDVNGLILDESLMNNLLLNKHLIETHTQSGFILRNRLRETSEKLVEQYSIKNGFPGRIVSELSGGNRQKVVLGRELENDLEFIYAVEPVRGLDIGSSEEVKSYMRKLKKAGGTVLVLSGDVDFLLSVCDRVGVLYRGTVSYTAAADKVDYDLINRTLLGYSTN